MPFDPARFTEEARRNWDSAAPGYADLSASFFSPITAAFIDFCGLKPGQRILDLACGPGTVTLSAARAVGPSGSVTGADLSPEMLAIAKRRAAEAGLHADFSVQNAEKLGFPDGSFDALICQLGLMLFSRPEAALKEMSRVVKPGGRVACLVQGAREKMVFTSLLMGVMLEHAPQIKEEGAPTLYAFSGPGVLEKALAVAGLRAERARRLEGTFAFASPLAYWETMTSGAGRTGAVLRSLAPEVRERVREDVLRKAEGYRVNGGVAIPFEVVMARARKA